MNHQDQIYIHFIALIVLLALSWTAYPAAGWSNDPAVNTPVCTEAFEQRNPLVIGDGANGFITCWFDQRGGSEYRVYAQRLGPAGEPLWAAGGVPVCTEPAYFYMGSVLSMISDGSGGAIICWKDTRSDQGDIYAQRLSPDGLPLWSVNGVAVCSESGLQTLPVMAADGQHGAIIVWDDGREVSTSQIYAQRLSPNGTPLWIADGIAVSPTERDQNRPQVVTDGSGGAIIAFQDDRWFNDDILAQRLDGSGLRLWGAAGVAVCTDPAAQEYPRLISDGSGGAIVCWRDLRNGTGHDLYAQRLDAAGAVQWTADGEAICTAAGEQNTISLVSDGVGGAFISWLDERDLGVTDLDVYVQRMDAGGTMLWTANGVPVCAEPYAQWGCLVAGDGNGGAYLAWNHGSASNGIFAQRLDAAGSALWPEDVPIFMPMALETRHDLLGLGARGMVSVCAVPRDGVEYDIYAQWVDQEGQVGGFEPNTVAADFSCSPSSGRVPFTTQMSLVLSNSYSGLTRRISGVINVQLANGGKITNWRSGSTNITPHQHYQSSWAQQIPALPALLGTSTFTLRAEDVTPAPYNHPPYPSSGDVDFAACSLTATAP